MDFMFIDGWGGCHLLIESYGLEGGLTAFIEDIRYLPHGLRFFRASINITQCEEEFSSIIYVCLCPDLVNSLEVLQEQSPQTPIRDGNHIEQM